MGSTISQQVKRPQLVGWKEIGSYLGYSIRHCKRLEDQLGLPIRRLKDSPKSTVFAYIDELEEWKDHTVIPKEPPKTGPDRKRRFSWPLVYIPAMAISIVLILAMIKRKADAQPVSISVSRSLITALDEKGSQIWKYDTGITNLWDNESYQRHANYRKYNLGLRDDAILSLPLYRTEDLDGDTDVEVLFAIKRGDEHDEGRLLCLDSKGRLIWEYETGKKISCGGQEFPHESVIVGIDTADFDHDGRSEIVVISHTLMQFPTQVLILDSAGKKISEYWNSGQINDFVCGDIDHDGNIEILLAGQNEEFHLPALIVLDGSNVKGVSPNSAAFRCGDSEGSEMYYILFPQSEIDKILTVSPTLDKVEIGKDGAVTVMTSRSEIYYKFDGSLRIQEIILGNSFRKVNWDLAADKSIAKPLDLDELKMKLSKGLRYWDPSLKRWRTDWSRSSPSITDVQNP